MKFLYVLSLFLLLGCNSNDEENKISDEEQRLNEFKEKYSSALNIDTLDYNFTIQYQDIFENSKDSVFVSYWSCSLLDIKKQQGRYYTYLHYDSYPYPIIIILSCTKEQAEELVKLTYFNSFSVLFKMESFENVNFTIDASSEIVDNGESCETSIYLDVSNQFIIRGVLQDYLYDEL
jgi:hypothetical protein